MSNEYIKEYFDRVIYARLRIKALQDEIIDVCDTLTGAGIHSPTKTRNHKDLSNVFVKREKLEKELKRVAAKYIDRYQAASDLIERSHIDDLSKTVLRMRYLQGMKFEDIAEKTNYSCRHILRIHGKALKGITDELRS